MPSSSVAEVMREALARMRSTAENSPAIQAHVAASIAEDEAMERATQTKARERAWSERAIPCRLWPMLHASAAGDDGDGPRETDALRAVGRFLAHGEARTLLVLAGGTGTGKTVAAAWGCAFHAGRMVKAVDLVRIGLFDQGTELPGLAGARTLAIDDLGMEPLDQRGYGYAALFDLLDRRYDANRKTIVTTNLAMPEFRERYGTGPGARLWDRVREVGMWVDLPGASMRGRP